MTAAAATGVAVVGGGLAGSEAAWALAERGYKVTLFEMRPKTRTAAHQTDRLAEIVCSNSFKSLDLTNAHGLLKAELRALGSVLLPAADQALAVDLKLALTHDWGIGGVLEREWDLNNRNPFMGFAFSDMQFIVDESNYQVDKGLVERFLPAPRTTGPTA